MAKLYQFANNQRAGRIFQEQNTEQTLIGGKHGKGTGCLPSHNNTLVLAESRTMSKNSIPYYPCLAALGNVY